MFGEMRRLSNVKEHDASWPNVWCVIGILRIW